MPDLMDLVAQIATADSPDSLLSAIRASARSLIRCDGITVVLRDGDLCHYADEDAIAPLWKGRRFPIDACISGWCMLQGLMAVIPDVFADPRIPHDVYRPTFVKSLLMAPASSRRPVAALGVYWQDHHHATWEEQSHLQALADVAGGMLATHFPQDRIQDSA